MKNNEESISQEKEKKSRTHQRHDSLFNEIILTRNLDNLENNKTETDENQNDTPQRKDSLQKSVERRVSITDQEKNFKISFNDWNWNSDFREINKNKEKGKTNEKNYHRSQVA